MTRVIAGTAGGRTLRTPPGSGTRPTSDRVREAVFSALDARDAVRGARVLDLYAGSGALGLEAASRGAARVVLVESDRRAADVIAGNARELKLPGTRVVRSTVAAHLFPDPAPDDPSDLVFVDPPYDLDEAALAAGARPPAGRLARTPGAARRRALHPQPRARLARRHRAGHQAEEVRRDHHLVRHPRLTQPPPRSQEHCQRAQVVLAESGRVYDPDSAKCS